MPDIPITCIRLSPGGTGHAAITHLGSRQYGMLWTLEVAVDLARRESYHFYLIDFLGLRIPLEIRDSDTGRPTLQARPDGEWSDDLRRLGDCPSAPWRLVI